MAIILQAFYFQSEWFIQRYYREFTSGNLRKNWNQGYCEQTALNTSFALLPQLENRRQLCVCYDLKSSVKSSWRTRRLFFYYKFLWNYQNNEKEVHGDWRCATSHICFIHPFFFCVSSSVLYVSTLCFIQNFLLLSPFINR